MIIAPSVLSLDFTKFQQQMLELNRSDAAYLHFDVMDGHFVPNLTFGPDILKAMNQMTDKVMDVHLMVTDPIKYAGVFIKAGADIITFHVEAVSSEEGLRFVQDLHAQGIKVGVTLKPKTKVEALLPYLPVVDMVLIMSVEPGFGGQSFMQDMLDKVRFVKAYRNEHHYSYLIEIDGGIDARTALLAKDAGCDILVAGSYVFKHPEGIVEAVKGLL